MASVHGTKEGERLGPAEFAKEYPVGTHSQRSLQQVFRTHPCLTCLPTHGDQSNRVGVIETDFRRVLDDQCPACGAWNSLAEEVEELHRKYKDRGFEVLGFPCNQFAGQEPGNADEIANFCSLTYEVDFPMMSKIDVNGPKADPFYAWLKGQKKGLLGSESVKWNFTKFLIDRSGAVVARFPPNAEPKSLQGAIEALL